MIGRMIRACGADEVSPLGSLFKKRRFLMITDKKAASPWTLARELHGGGRFSRNFEGD